MVAAQSLLSPESGAKKTPLFRHQRVSSKSSSSCWPNKNVFLGPEERAFYPS